MLPELTFIKGYRTTCVSIIQLQINYKRSSIRVKNQKIENRK